MKNVIAAFAMLILTAGAAQAEQIELNSSVGANDFATRYTLDSFKIASNSGLLKGLGEVASGTIQINETTKQLRLVLGRHMNCPMGAMCIAMVPAPTIITLPIRKISNNVCGGVTIVAERNLLMVDGGLTRIEIQDQNGGFNSCGTGNADDITFVKRVKVLVTEKGPRDMADTLSVLSGFPSNR